MVDDNSASTNLVKSIDEWLNNCDVLTLTIDSLIQQSFNSTDRLYCLENVIQAELDKVIARRQQIMNDYHPKGIL